MRIRPWPIVIIAFICIITPLFNIVYSSGLMNMSIGDYARMIYIHKPTHEIVFWILLPIAIGISILAFNRWSYFFFLAFMVSVVYETFNQWRIYSDKFPVTYLLLAEALNFAAIGYFLLPSVRIIYFSPMIQWWKQKPRFICDLTAKIRNSSEEFDCSIKNISEGGTLLTTSTDLQLNSLFDIQFKLLDTNISCHGKVVHTGYDGYGIMFTEFQDEREFKKTVRKLKDLGYKQRVETVPWTTSLKEWFLTFLKTGKGLVPKVDPNNKN